MKIKYLFVIFCSTFLFSCESKEDNSINNLNFRLESSEGNQITEKDILFYDSTTHILFLRNNVDLLHTFDAFNVLVNSDTIYKGEKHSCYLSSFPKTTFSISDCFFYGQNVIELNYYPHSADLRNDRRIIDAFTENNLLRSGVTCAINNVKVKNYENYSEVSCKITLTNHDLNSYYIIDPEKMGKLDFNYYTGGLSFNNLETKTSSFLRWSDSNPDYWKLSIDDFFVLKGKSTVNYTFTSSDYYRIDKGLNSVRFRFCGWTSNNSEINLTQKSGRVWVGNALAIDTVLVE